MPRKQIRSISIAALLGSMVLFGCHKEPTCSDWGSDIIRIGYLVPNLDNPFFVDLTESAKAMETDKVKVFIQASPDELMQNHIIEDFISQGVDAICVSPINSESIIPAIIKANSAHIPVINVDNKINMESAEKAGAKIDTYIGSDNFEGGRLAGQFIVEKLNGKGKVAVLEGIAGHDAAVKRKSGFSDALKDQPGIHVVASQAADWNRQKATDIFLAILTAHPDIKAVFGCNDEMALGAVAAIKSKSIPPENIIIVGFDAIDEAGKAVKDGEMDATIAQQPVLMGRQSIEIVLKIHEGSSIEKVYTTPLKIIKN